MSRFKLPDGRTVQADSYFNFVFEDDVVHINSVRALSMEERERYGIEEIIEQPRPDDRFYFVNEDPSQPGSYIATARNIDSVKEFLIANVKRHAASLLAQTDWQVIRSIDGIPMSDGVAANRTSIRDYGNTLKAAINVAESIETLASIDLTSQWPA